MRAYTGFVLVVAACCCAAPTVWARTAADVTGVSAELDVRDPERAQVELRVRLRVRAGKLASFELTGLDPDLELPTVQVPRGVGTPAIAREAPDQLRLTWLDSRTAPGSGAHTLVVRYISRRLAAGPSTGSTRRVTWTLPRWAERLADVQIRVLGPRGLHPIPAPEPNLGETIDREGAPPVFTYTRAELPRTAIWRVRFDLPAPPSERSDEASRGDTDLREVLDQSVWPALLGVCLGALVVAKRRVRRRRALSSALVPRLEAANLDAVAFALCVLSAALLQDVPGLALACAIAGVASGLERRASRSTLTLTAAAAGSGGQSAWFDATRPSGAALLLGLYAAGLLAPAPARSAALTCVWLATPLFFSRTRLHER